MKILRNRDLNDRRRRRQISDQEIIRLHINQYQKGATIAAIAAQYGYTRRYISQRFKQLGLPVSRKIEHRAYDPDHPHKYQLNAPAPELTDKEIVNIHVNYYQTGANIRQIARRFGIDYRRLSRRFQELNLPISRRIEKRAYRPPDHLYPPDNPWPPE